MIAFSLDVSRIVFDVSSGLSFEGIAGIAGFNDLAGGVGGTVGGAGIRGGAPGPVVVEGGRPLGSGAVLGHSIGGNGGRDAFFGRPHFADAECCWMLGPGPESGGSDGNGIDGFGWSGIGGCALAFWVEAGGG